MSIVRSPDELAEAALARQQARIAARDPEEHRDAIHADMVRHYTAQAERHEREAQGAHTCEPPEPEGERDSWDCPICGRNWYAYLEWGHVYREDGSEWRKESSDDGA